MSRPLLPAASLKTTVSTYLTPAEKAAVAEKANAAHMTLAAFLRKASLGQRVHAVPTGNTKKWSELARTTAALSNLAKHANAAAKRLVESGNPGIVLINVPPELLAALRAEVEALRRDLLGLPAGENK
jgi:hypothetical protein